MACFPAVPHTMSLFLLSGMEGRRNATDERQCHGFVLSLPDGWFKSSRRTRSRFAQPLLLTQSRDWFIGRRTPPLFTLLQEAAGTGRLYERTRQGAERYRACDTRTVCNILVYIRPHTHMQAHQSIWKFLALFFLGLMSQVLETCRTKSFKYVFLVQTLGTGWFRYSIIQSIGQIAFYSNDLISSSITSDC